MSTSEEMMKRALSELTARHVSGRLKAVAVASVYEAEDGTQQISWTHSDCSLMLQGAVGMLGHAMRDGLQKSLRPEAS